MTEPWNIFCVWTLDDVRADLDEVRPALRSLEDRQVSVERTIGLVGEDMACRDRRSDAIARA